LGRERGKMTVELLVYIKKHGNVNYLKIISYVKGRERLGLGRPLRFFQHLLAPTVCQVLC
jgi:hypothetical protein